MYWQTTEKSTLEQLNSTCNYTAQFKKTNKTTKQTNMFYIYIRHCKLHSDFCSG